MAQLEHIEVIEKRLWSAADTLRANSNYASNEYFMPVMGLIFLRHAYSRYLSVKDEILANLPKRGGKTRELTKEDFSQRSAIYLRPEAQFDYLVALKDSDDRAKAIIAAMESIESDYSNLKGELPKAEYQELDNAVLGQLLRNLDPDELKRTSGDVFGRIYEYFLTQFADLKAHDNGEFFTPVSLVSLIANVLEPRQGTVLDPACGSGGMFVQSAHFVERLKQNPAERLTFRGLEKNATTIRLAKMNLAVHGLEGDIQKAITYYEDPHELISKADFVMANPPFNVDEVDADKVKNDPRLPFGLPGVNKAGKVSNGNYLWINYFYSYLNEKGRSGFVMSSQASSAGRDEAKVRQKLIETGHVDIMIAIRPNFFYTRTVPCELWFFDRGKEFLPSAPPGERGRVRGRDTVLMIDARNVYRKVTRKIYDFSTEQEKNILAIIWLYRGQSERFLGLVADYCTRTIEEAGACFKLKDIEGREYQSLENFSTSLRTLLDSMNPFLNTLLPLGEGLGVKVADALKELQQTNKAFSFDKRAFQEAIDREKTEWKRQKKTNDALKQAVDRLEHLADSSRDLVKQTDLLYKLACRLIDVCQKEYGATATNGDAPAKARKSLFSVIPAEAGIQSFRQTANPLDSGFHRSDDFLQGRQWSSREMARARKAADEVRQRAVEQLKQVRYFWKQGHWLTQRFPDGKFRDVEGLVKLVGRAEIKANDWSLTPGRYVGVALEEEDENFDFEEALRDIHIELEGLNAEAVELAAQISRNFRELGI